MAKKQAKKTQKQPKKVVSNRSQKSIIVTILSLIIIVAVILLMVSTTLKENMDNKSSADGGRQQECQITVTTSITSAKKVKPVKCQENGDVGFYLDLSSMRQLRCSSPNYPVAKGCVYTDVME